MNLTCVHCGEELCKLTSKDLDLNDLRLRCGNCENKGSQVFTNFSDYNQTLIIGYNLLYNKNFYKVTYITNNTTNKLFIIYHLDGNSYILGTNLEYKDISKIYNEVTNPSIKFSNIIELHHYVTSILDLQVFS